MTVSFLGARTPCCGQIGKLGCGGRVGGRGLCRSGAVLDAPYAGYVSQDWPHVYAHVDMDAFYVSVELQRRPELSGKPVVVAGSGPRAVVTTASYEARKFGVFSATPAERARRLCPQAVFVPPDFDHYRARSREVMQTLHDHVERVEVVGLDEAYLDLSEFERPRAAARRVKASITARTGLGCSIGIGPNKLVAKVASDAEKPDGFVELTAEEARERFAQARPGLIPGIGPKTAERLQRQGIETLGALAAAPDDKLTEWFGPRLGPYLGALPGSRTSEHWKPSVWPSPSRARPPSTTTCAASGSSSPSCGASPSSSARRSRSNKHEAARSASR